MYSSTFSVIMSYSISNVPSPYIRRWCFSKKSPSLAINLSFCFEKNRAQKVNEYYEDITKTLTQQKDIDKVIHDWKEEGIKVEKARWGRSVITKGKIKIELSKDVDASKLTLAQVQEMIEKKTPAKKTATKKAPAKKTTAKKK